MYNAIVKNVNNDCTEVIENIFLRSFKHTVTKIRIYERSLFTC